MRKISIIALISTLFVSAFAVAAEVNIFNARHYKADSEIYDKFTKKTGIKVNLINGKSGALEKRMIEEGADSSADLYITADAGRCGAFQAKGMTQKGLVSPTIKSSVPKNFRTTHWVGVAKRARIIYYSPERVTGAELSGMSYEGLADPNYTGRQIPFLHTGRYGAGSHRVYPGEQLHCVHGADGRVADGIGTSCEADGFLHWYANCREAL